MPRTRSVLLLVLGALAAGAAATLVLVACVEMPQLAGLGPIRQPGGVQVTYYPDRNYETFRKLYQPVDLDLPADTPLQDVLKHLAKKYDVAFFFDAKAFDAGQIQAIRKTPITDRLEGVALKSVLHILLHRTGLTFRAVNPGIVLTTDSAARSPRYLGRVDVMCDYEPLQSVLRQLARKAEHQIVLANADGEPDRFLPFGRYWMIGAPPPDPLEPMIPDNDPIDLSPSKEEMYQQPVSIVLRNVEVETAVRLLTEQAGLAAFRHRDDLWVSSKESLRRWVAVNPRGYLRAVPQPPRRELEPLVPSDNASPKRR